MSRRKVVDEAQERRDELRRGRLWVEMDRLWAQIPEAGCQGYCHASCAPTGMSDAERDRIQRVYELRIRDGEVKPGTRDCPALNREGRCGVYLARPTVCRLWGASDTMPCTCGCEPDKGRLNELETMLIMNASLSLGEDSPSLPRDYLITAINDEQVGPLIQRFIAGDRSHLGELRDKLIALWKGSNGGGEVEDAG